METKIPDATSATQLAIRATRDVAEQLATAHASLLRIRRVLIDMRRSYQAHGDGRAVSVATAILRVIADELAAHGLVPDTEGGDRS